MLLAVLIATLLAAGWAPQAKGRPDIVLIVLDDVGDVDVDLAQTPNMHSLAAAGVRFRRAYSHAWCAPTRDSLASGRTLGIFHGDACAAPGPKVADHGDLTLGKMMDGAGYRTLHLGKWHLGPSDVGPYRTSANLAGFDDVRATFPIGDACNQPGPLLNRIDDTIVSQWQGYTTALMRDELLAWWGAHPDEPRFAVVNFNAAHSPYIFPDASDLPPGYPIPPSPTPREAYEAEIAGIDFVLGDVLSAVGPDTYVILLGDNGTPADVPGPGQDPSKLKLTCYEGGVRVPLIVSGPGVSAGLESSAMVHVSDILPSIAQMIGIKPPPDVQGSTFGAALVGLPAKRTSLFVWGPNRLDSAMIGRRWKLLVDATGVEHLLDLQSDPLEQSPLPPVGPEADALRAERDAILAEG